MKLTLSVTATTPAKTVALAKLAAKAVLKTYPGATVTTESKATGASALTTYLAASAAAVSL